MIDFIIKSLIVCFLVTVIALSVTVVFTVLKEDWEKYQYEKETRERFGGGMKL